ncbi:MAG: siroheme synthase CysG [Hyphomicrobiaceae bacterium]|jgi:uroporphyrin-III C-methyltransferase / precorrin-2 dehydrogenase / sirohydrochlorin ferrochelatase
MPQPDATAARQPRSVRPRRMDALATLPVFFKLAGQRVVVAGGSEAATWKAELLSAAGATVEVYAPDPCAEMEALAVDPPRGRVLLERRAWSAFDFESAALVIGATDEETEAARIFEAARKAGIPVNVIDKPAFCSFQFGAIVNRSPLVVGISTDGAAPVFAQAIRSRIEALLPAGFARWAAVARAWRTMLVRLDLSATMRRRFWELFAARALAAPDRTPTEQDLHALLTESRNHAGAAPVAGSVILVGAGPGDAELLTLKAVRALRSADVILFDDLVAPEILDFARREAKRMLVGKTGHQPSCRQDDINALMVGLARSGKRVVRLKSGDPMIFGRAGEEIAALQRAGVPVEVVPGVTAAQGAAASLKVSLTHRAQARRVQFVAGHAHNGQLPQDLDLAALADSGATTAVYMPRATLGLLSERLIAAGADPDRPASLIANATRPEETVMSGTLATLPCLATGLSIDGPCILLIGSVLQSHQCPEVAQLSSP